MMKKDVSLEQDCVSADYLGEHGRARLGKIGVESYDFGRAYQGRYFVPYCDDEKTILDFGCGDGFLLRRLPARRRIGVEVNPAAVEKCERQCELEGVEIDLYGTMEAVDSDSVDVVFSNHCLEHVIYPYSSLQQMCRVLRPGGKVVVVVPFDDFRIRQNRAWKPKQDDSHPLSASNMNHLHTWNPMNLGNLATEAGLKVLTTRIYTNSWSPRFFWVGRVFGLHVFGLACHVWGTVTKRREVFCLATK